MKVKNFYYPKQSFFKRLIGSIILLPFLTGVFLPSFAEAQDIFLPTPGTMAHLSPAFAPPMLKGIKVHPKNPFLFDFILDNGDHSPDEDQTSTLVKYFLASLTTPEKDMWVNLSPYEKDRIVPESFGQTEMGRDLLAQDYLLKQITASLMYPEDELGKKFWDRVSAEAKKRFGTTDIPINTFNKVWIVPGKAVVYENLQSASAYVLESSLKVMLEEDYVALSKLPLSLSLDKEGEGGVLNTNALGSQIIREIVIPALTKEVNEGKNFAQLRQVYNSLILAAWYKKKIRDSILSQVYVDQNKVAGIEYEVSVIASHNGAEQSVSDKELIYQQYLEAFKKGTYNYIKEEVDPATQDMIPKKYFSGGFAAAKLELQITTNTKDLASSPIKDGHNQVVRVQVASAPQSAGVQIQGPGKKPISVSFDQIVGATTEILPNFSHILNLYHVKVPSRFALIILNFISDGFESAWNQSSQDNHRLEMILGINDSQTTDERFVGIQEFLSQTEPQVQSELRQALVQDVELNYAKVIKALEGDFDEASAFFNERFVITKSRLKKLALEETFYTKPALRNFIVLLRSKIGFFQWISQVVTSLSSQDFFNQLLEVTKNQPKLAIEIHDLLIQETSNFILSKPGFQIPPSMKRSTFFKGLSTSIRVKRIAILQEISIREQNERTINRAKSREQRRAHVEGEIPAVVNPVPKITLLNDPEVGVEPKLDRIVLDLPEPLLNFRKLTSSMTIQIRLGWTLEHIIKKWSDDYKIQPGELIDNINKNVVGHQEQAGGAKSLEEYFTILKLSIASQMEGSENDLIDLSEANGRDVQEAGMPILVFTDRRYINGTETIPPAVVKKLQLFFKDHNPRQTDASKHQSYPGIYRFKYSDARATYSIYVRLFLPPQSALMVIGWGDQKVFHREGNNNVHLREEFINYMKILDGRTIKNFSDLESKFKGEFQVLVASSSLEGSASSRAQEPIDQHTAGDPETKGGIDFNADKINLETQTGGSFGEIKFEMNPAQLQELQNVPGFTPIIINVQPMINVRMFLGLKDDAATPLTMSKVE